MAERRILLITSTRIGDVIMNSGVARRLIADHPGAKLTVAGGKLPIRLFEDDPAVERLIPVVKKPNGGHWIELWRAVVGTRWERVVDLRGSAIAYVVRAGRRDVWRPRSKGAPPIHKAEEAAAVCGFSPPPEPGFVVSAATEAAATVWLKPDGRPVLAMAPVAGTRPKTWAPERWRETAATLLGPGGRLEGGRLVLLGGKEDRAAGEIVAQGLDPDRVVWGLGEPSLLATYAALKRVELFLGADSGMSHLAAAAGVPTLAAFGPTDERLYAPRGGRVVRAAGTTPGEGRIEDLTPAEVVAAAEALLDDRARAVQNGPA